MIIGNIKNGLVLDHIPAGKGMELYHHLKLETLSCEVALIMNAPSEKLGKKDIIKIAGMIEPDLDLLGFIAPHISINVIEDGVLREKRHPRLPETIRGIIKCRNPRCISSVERELPQLFRLTDAEAGTYRCIYCDTKA